MVKRRELFGGTDKLLLEEVLREFSDMESA
jgi:hypothetical protein